MSSVVVCICVPSVVRLCLCVLCGLPMSVCPVWFICAGMMAATYNTLSDSVPLQAGPEEKLLQDPPPQPPTWNMEAFIDAIKTKVQSSVGCT